MAKKRKKSSNAPKTVIKNNDLKKELLILLTFFIIAAIIISTITNLTNINKKKEKQGVQVSELREFIPIDLSGIVDKIDNKDTFVLYVGYDGCQACEQYNPILKRFQSHYEEDTYYLNYKSIDKNSNDWKNLTDSININQKITIPLDGEEKSVDDKIGNIMRNYGYTPVTIYFIEGKCVNAKIGTMNTSNLKQFFNK